MLPKESYYFDEDFKLSQIDVDDEPIDPPSLIIKETKHSKKSLNTTMASSKLSNTRNIYDPD